MTEIDDLIGRLCIHPNHGEPMSNAKNAAGRRNGRR